MSQSLFPLPPGKRETVRPDPNSYSAAAEVSKKKAQAQFTDPIVTEIVPLTVFYPAEGYHQDYYSNNKRRIYCNSN